MVVVPVEVEVGLEVERTWVRPLLPNFGDLSEEASVVDPLTFPLVGVTRRDLRIVVADCVE